MQAKAAPPTRLRRSKGRAQFMRLLRVRGGAEAKTSQSVIVCGGQSIRKRRSARRYRSQAVLFPMRGTSES